MATSLPDTLSKWLGHCVICLIKVYRFFIAPLLGQRCRFYPSCSHYAEESIQSHGIVKGTYLSVVRLMKCHPWHAGGYDPVPPTRHTHHCHSSHTAN